MTKADCRRGVPIVGSISINILKIVGKQHFYEKELSDSQDERYLYIGKFTYCSCIYIMSYKCKSLGFNINKNLLLAKSSGTYTNESKRL